MVLLRSYPMMQHGVIATCALIVLAAAQGMMELWMRPWLWSGKQFRRSARFAGAMALYPMASLCCSYCEESGEGIGGQETQGSCH